jgi:hypothetical protein
MEVERLLGSSAGARKMKLLPEGHSKKAHSWNLVVKVHRIALCPALKHCRHQCPILQPDCGDFEAIDSSARAIG